MNKYFALLIPGAFLIGMMTGCASGPKTGVAASSPGKIEPGAIALLDSVSLKLGSANTLQVEATHKVEPPIGLTGHLDRGRIELAVKRPNQFYAIQPAGHETREIAFDGRLLCVMHPGPKHHALEPLEAKTIEQFAQLVDERFGFRPPVAELLASDMKTEFLKNVTSARVLDQTCVGWTRCEHLQLEQEGLRVELWVGAKDHLPRRMFSIYTDISGHPTWDIRFTKWKLNEPLNESLFSKRPAADSVKVQMVKTR